ncbi:MAG: MdtA/MuxA family multidrug efflux RND transporter periplasmic adaptor subunit [Burkholderiales bacterium]|nr:MdtA/MuxA family multidrug efflux RND transporter periplasmic adaptor subunit [Burkholderiales bacterium]
MTSRIVNWKSAAAVLVVIAVAAGGWWYYHRTDASAPAEAGNGPSGNSGNSGKRGGGRDGGNKVQPVSVVPAQKRDIRLIVTAIGNISAANTAIVRTKADGELKAIYFKEGQAVQAGQLLAQIDPKPFQIALSLAQGTLARDQAQLKNAELDYQRYKDLVEKQAAPKQQMDTQEALVQQLHGTILSDQASVDNAKLQLSYTRVTAPISGLAGLKQADLGNIVHSSDTNGLVSITQTQPVAIVFAIPDVRLDKLRQQMKNDVPLRVEAWDREQKNILAEGSVANTDNSIDLTTGTIKVKALFPNKDNGLFPNQFVNVRLQLDTMKDALAVPVASVQRGTVGNFVYVVGEGGVVTLKPVTTLATDGDWVAVKAELRPGDQLVADGADRLRDGGKVEVIAALARPGGGDEPRGGKRRKGGGGASASTSTSASTSVPASTPAASAPAPASAAETRK